MATAPHESRPVLPTTPPSWKTQLLVPEMWTTLAIVVIWLAVLCAAVWAPDIRTSSAGGDTGTWPAAVPLALLAFLATWVLARYGYSRNRKTGDRSLSG